MVDAKLPIEKCVYVSYFLWCEAESLRRGIKPCSSFEVCYLRSCILVVDHYWGSSTHPKLSHLALNYHLGLERFVWFSFHFILSYISLLGNPSFGID